MITLHNGNETIELLNNDDSYSYEAIMGEDTLTLYFSHPGYLDIPVGSWCEFYGKRYSLKKDSNFKKNGERNYEYILILETSKADTKLWKIRNMVDNRIKFSYTAKPKEHLKLIVDNLNRRSSGWVMGECIEGTEKMINYNHTYILDAINQLSETYETECQITETVIEGVHTKAVHLKRVEYNKDNPLTLSYGKGHGFKTGVGRESGEIPPEIILVETTDRNIDYSKYGAKELLMPKSQTIRYDGTHFEGEDGFNADIARTYKTDEYGTAVMRADRELITAKEDSLDCTEIYPSRIGTVSDVFTVVEKGNTFYDFKDKDIPASLDFSQYRIDGEKATVIFQSGMLSGKEFELEQTDKALTGYVHSERRFKLVSQEIDGITMPDGDVWMPKVGDKYAVFGIQLPDAYICNNATRTGASWDVFKEVVKYLFEHENKEFVFTGTLDGIWAKKRWLQIGGKIVLGGFVNFTDKQFHPEGSLIRMTGIKRYVNNPYSPEIELSNSPVGTSIDSALNKIETNEVTVEENHKKALQFTKRYYRDAKETMEMLADSLLNFSGAINPVTVATMQMLVGDESLQYRFVNSKTNPAVVNHDISYNPSTKRLNAPAGIIQHMTLGIKNLSNTHVPGDYKYWDMANYDSPTLIEPEKKFYLYAKCSKDNQSGTFQLSETAIGLKQIDGYYHLLVGILNSENNSERSFATLYGFTEILPGRITTDKIVSANGQTYFDLVKSEIGGCMKFLSGSSGLKNLEEWDEASKAISEAQNAADKANAAVSELSGYVDGAFSDGIISEAEAKAIEKYINTINNTKSAVEATYNKLYLNVYLEGDPKTNLLNAKVSLMGTINNLVSSISTAIADGKTTVAEKNDVDSKFSAFNSALASFNTAVETANKAIQDKLKNYSDSAQSTAENALTAAGNAERNAKNHVAKSLGYDNYAALENAARAGETIIDGGKINTLLINAEAIFTAALLANLIRTTELIAEKFNLKYGSVGDFDVSSSLTAKRGDDEMLLSAKLIRFTNEVSSVYIGADIRPGSIGGSLVTPMLIDVNRPTSNYAPGANSGIDISVQGGMLDDSDAFFGNHALLIEKGDICGFRLKTRRVTASCTLSLMDSVIMAVTKDITIRIPYNSDVEDGQMFFIRNHSNGNVNIYGVISALGYPTSSNATIRLNAGDLAILIFDKYNSIWTANYAVRW